MKVLLINGSPHKNGCTYTALTEVTKPLNESGIETEILHIGTNAIRGCIGCGQCVGKGVCIFNDDMANEIIQKAKEADGFIVGSPVYYASPNGSLISLLDRVFYAGKANFVHKPAAAIVSARRGGTTASLEVINKYFTFAQMPLVSSTYWNMVHGSKPEDVLQDAEGLQTMRNLGRNMAWLLKCIEAGKEKGIALPQSETNNRTNFIR